MKGVKFWYGSKARYLFGGMNMNVWLHYEAKLLLLQRFVKGVDKFLTFRSLLLSTTANL